MQKLYSIEKNQFNQLKNIPVSELQFVGELPKSNFFFLILKKEFYFIKIQYKTLIFFFFINVYSFYKFQDRIKKKFTLSTGPGGQNVNKSNFFVEILKE